MNPLFNFFLVFVILFITSGCASLDAKLEREFDKMRRGPHGAAYKNITNFSDSLVCMDKLMLQKDMQPISILIEDLDDKTEEVKTGTRDMFISAVSRMTMQSKKIKVITYGKDTANLISFMKAANTNQAYSKMPIYDIQGSITQFDKGLVSADTSLGLFRRGNGGGGLARGASLDVIALDLSVLYAHDMSIVPGVSSSNSVAIFQRGDSLNTDASISKMGIYFDLNMGTSEGKAQALRNLVELAAVELMGKLTGVSYHTCLSSPKSIPEPSTKPSVAITQTDGVLPQQTEQPVLALASMNGAASLAESLNIVAKPQSENVLIDDGVVRLKRIISTEVATGKIQ